MQGDVAWSLVGLMEALTGSAAEGILGPDVRDIKKTNISKIGDQLPIGLGNLVTLISCIHSLLSTTYVKLQSKSL